MSDSESTCPRCGGYEEPELLDKNEVCDRCCAEDARDEAIMHRADADRMK